jgi:hypothetical protein
MRLGLHPDAQHRPSKHGLVLASPAGEVALLEHPPGPRASRPAAVPTQAQELLERLGPPVSPDLCRNLVALGVLCDVDTDADADRSLPPVLGG